MLKASKNATSATADQRLSNLIKLKRLEQPDAAFWDTFEQEFHSRQLTTFVRIQPLHTRVRKACMILARKAAPPVAACGAVALTLLAVSNTRYLISDNIDSTPTDNLLPRFPVEAESTDSFFVVQSEQPAADEDSLGSSENGTIYQINLLDQKLATPDYLLNTAPVTFSNGFTEQAFGAKIISAQPRR